MGLRACRGGDGQGAPVLLQKTRAPLESCALTCEADPERKGMRFSAGSDFGPKFRNHGNRVRPAASKDGGLHDKKMVLKEGLL